MIQGVASIWPFGYRGGPVGPISDQNADEFSKVAEAASTLFLQRGQCEIQDD